MSDDRKNSLIEGLGDLDWDSALDEWEKNTFVPEVARDADTNKVAAPLDEPAAAAKAKADEEAAAKANKPAPSPQDLAVTAKPGATASIGEKAPTTAKMGGAPALPRPKLPPSEPTFAAAPPQGSMIAPVPRELRDDPSPVSSGRTSAPPGSTPPSAPPPPQRASVPPPQSMRGGLNQLFNRPKGATPSKPMLPIPAPAPRKDPTSVTQQIARPAGGFDPSVPLDELIGEAGLRSERESERTLVKSSPLEKRLTETASNEPSITTGTPNASADFPPDDVTAERPAARSPQAAPYTSLASSDAPTVSRTGSLDNLDDDNETVIHKRKTKTDEADEPNAQPVSARTGSLSDADTATRLPADDEMPTIGRPSNLPPERISQTGSARRSKEPPPLPTGDEVIASQWLDAEKTRSFLARIAFLEEEARALTDNTARGRALLAVSELCALVGDRDRALAFAIEARDTAPNLPLAWRQARQLMPREPEALAEALDAEAARSPSPSARAHSALLAADVLRIHDRGDAAVDRWETACKLDPADTRAPIARAALALAQNDHTSGALRLADNSELIAFDKAVATALRLRGVERAGAEVDDMPINDGLRHARIAFGAGDVVAAAQSAGEIATVTEIAKGAHWLSASLGAAHIASRRGSGRSLKTLANDGEPLARRALAARGIELGDPELVNLALAEDAPLSPAERVTLRILAAKGDDASSYALPEKEVEALVGDKALEALSDALLSIAPMTMAEGGANEDDVVAWAERTAGKAEARELATLGHLLAAKASNAAIDGALAEIASPRPASAGGVAIETAVRGKRWAELSEALSSLPSSGDDSGSARHIAAAIVAERAGNRDRAKDAWGLAANEGAPHDGVLRIAADLDRDLDLGASLLRLAEEMPDGPASAILRLEAIARSSEMGDVEQAPILDRVHRAAPTLGIGGFLAERIGRRKGDLEEVLRWIQERRSYATDPLETALDAVREALLIADHDPELASTRLEEAHRARPDDVALRELYERLASEPPNDRGSWREKRAEAATGQSSALLWVEAALEHERTGDLGAALRSARKAAEAGDRGLSKPIIERTELLTGDTTVQTEALLDITKTSEDDAAKKEAFERLAYLDAFGKKDAAAALLWHRSINEIDPRYKPSLRWLEHAFISGGRDEDMPPVFEQIALALDGTAGGEATAHAQHSARLRARDSQAQPGDGASAWERTHDMARLAATQPESSLWALRALNAHARARKDEDAILSTTLSLLERTQRPPERASLLLRASEAAARLEKVEDARTYLEQAANEDPGDVVTWGFLAEVRERAGEPRGAAEACESLARTSVVRDHQLLAWHDAAKIWLDEVKDAEKAMAALEAAAEIDATYADIFPRLSALYADKNLDAELAHLLEKRLSIVSDVDERVGLEVDLARAFSDMGELGKAKASLESAIEKRPDHTTALGAMADLCAKEGDWAGAEQAYVRLARLLSDPQEQRAIYERLGEIYAVHAPNLSRAEVAYREVLKRSPNDTIAVLTKLVDVYKRSGDVQRAIETQQEIVTATTDPNARLANLVELAKIHETVGRDPRRSEQVLDSARKEFPTSVVALRAMAEFYARQRQMPAMQILLDRAAGDARRSFAQGRFVPALFQVLHAAFELRGKKDAARVVAATLAAVEGHPSELMGAEARAVDPRLDDLLAPEMISPALRALLHRAGDSLDAIAPIDLRAMKAQPLQPGTSIGATVGSVATVIGLGALQILVSPQLGRAAIPLSSNPPTLLVGEGLAKVKNERARVFVVVRALKMILAHASAMLRGTPQEVSSLIAGLFCTFNPSYTPQVVDMKRVTELTRRIGPALPRNLDPTVGVIALEAAGMLGSQWSQLAPSASAWANRVALLAVGDPNAALDAIAWGLNEEAAPTGSEERAAWIARHAEARDLMTFSVTDTYAEARVRLGLDNVK